MPVKIKIPFLSKKEEPKPDNVCYEFVKKVVADTMEQTSVRIVLGVGAVWAVTSVATLWSLGPIREAARESAASINAINADAIYTLRKVEEVYAQNIEITGGVARLLEKADECGRKLDLLVPPPGN